MSTLNPCSPTVVPTHSPLLLRWAHHLHGWCSRAHRRWREAAEVHAQQRAINGLSDSTLRDIGLAERRYHEPTLGMMDWERGRW